MLHIEQLLKGLSDLRIDVQNPERNATLLLRAEQAATVLAEYIQDDSAERELLSEFKDLHREVYLESERVRKAEDNKAEQLRKELHDAHTKAEQLKEELKQLKQIYQQRFGYQDVEEALKESMEIQEKLRQWQNARDEARAEVKQWQYKLAMLDEAAEVRKERQKELIKRDKLYYEFISSSLNIAIVNVKGPQVELAIMSETEDRTDQTWHCLTTNMEECDQRTTDYLWNAIEKTFQRKPLDPPGHTSMEVFRLSR
ncbi:hypothetical protein BgAZ_207530 [Babesia gibsoni]|uniref:Uncharacterized protein n=1 Tax=Babesia gibsoni TaxID=33632 RepID=A0AAD8USX2_BABGI|nr:hypothetical protein BgAZ_207530 [Babesia gibsoni]